MSPHFRCQHEKGTLSAVTELQRQRQADQDEIALLSQQARELQQRKKTMEDHARAGSV